MLATFDLDGVQRFADELNQQRSKCESVEGLECSQTEHNINCHVKLFQELTSALRRWVRAVFTGKAEFDPAVENILKKEAQRLLESALPVAALGHAMNWDCYEFANLNELFASLWRFEYL